MTSKACVDSGPKATESIALYKPKGEIQTVKSEEKNVADIEVYSTGNGPATVLILYDIFGWMNHSDQFSCLPTYNVVPNQILQRKPKKNDFD